VAKVPKEDKKIKMKEGGRNKKAKAKSKRPESDYTIQSKINSIMKTYTGKD
jgi:hypothetical protein